MSGESKLIKVGAIWQSTSKRTGEEFYSGQITVAGRSLGLLMFPNRYADALAPHLPTFVLYVSPEELAAFLDDAGEPAPAHPF